MYVLIKAGADVNVKSKEIVQFMLFVPGGSTPLTLAVNPEVVYVLIQAGGEVNAKTNYGTTPLMLASSRNDLEVFNMLLQAGADVNAKDDNGNTPLMYVIQITNNSTEVLSAIIQAGADVSAKNNEGKTALDFARAVNKPEFASILEAAAPQR